MPIAAASDPPRYVAFTSNILDSLGSSPNRAARNNPATIAAEPRRISHDHFRSRLNRRSSQYNPSTGTVATPISFDPIAPSVQNKIPTAGHAFFPRHDPLHRPASHSASSMKNPAS